MYEQLVRLEPVQDPRLLEQQLLLKRDKHKQTAEVNKGRKQRSTITTVHAAIQAAHENAQHLRITEEDAYDFRIQNLVFTAMLNVELDLPRIASEFGGLFDDGVFPAVICRFARPAGSASMFSPGKIVLTGMKHPYHAIYILMLISFNLYRHFGLVVRPHNLCIRNCIASASLGYKLDLARFYKDHQDCCRYEPSSFPGLHFPTNRPEKRAEYHNLMFGIFSSGKINTTGGIDTRLGKQAFEKLRLLLAQYRL